ncbi:sulfurtransferase [Rubricoccus marinus]|uniref:Sulfurtransferase n=1 Tax=Rubricoccus marinus TaxID=716817 RepID=A0A259U1F6_9BACT|nr:sulfurtransferase [Rubricoccus marinus]OZC03811.1 sulfurtransferase [Rubricoccus marinus]
MSDYAHPDVLVSTDWVSHHLADTANVRVIESNEDILLYATGHLHNAVHVDWTNDLQDPDVRDYISTKQFERLCSRLGIHEDTTVVFYGDKSNWWACYAFWTFKMFGHKDCRIMDGGRAKWVAEGRVMTTDVPTFESADYDASEPDTSIRAFRDDVMNHMKDGGQMVDVRSPQEYIGEVTHMAGYPQEGALRGGHIPGASNVPWSRAAGEDGTFKSRDELEAIYLEEQGLNPKEDMIAYCRIGERSSHTWFVLKYLLGFENVRNYDGSWTEWGNLVGAPIEKGEPDEN